MFIKRYLYAVYNKNMCQNENLSLALIKFQLPTKIERVCFFFIKERKGKTKIRNRYNQVLIMVKNCKIVSTRFISMFALRYICAGEIKMKDYFTITFKYDPMTRQNENNMIVFKCE